MSNGFLIFAGIVALGLAGLLYWALRGASKRSGAKDGLSVFERAPRHVSHMTQIRQALDPADLRYVAEKGGGKLAASVRKERRQVALLYLFAIRQDFEQSLRIARVIAVLSPEVSGSQEYERLRLAMVFRFRFQMVRVRLFLGNIALPEVNLLGQMVSSLTSEMEAAVAALGERAALAAELALQSEQ